MARELRRRARLWARGPASDDTTGALAATDLRVLGAAVAAILDGAGVDPAPHVAELERAAVEEPGTLSALTAAARRLEHRALRRHHRSYPLCGAAERRALLPHPPPRRWRSRGGARALVRRALVPTEARAHEELVGRVLDSFARTDAWRLAGYAAPPGAPRPLPAPLAEDHR